MATGATSSSFGRDHLECGICHESYKQPKLLDCVHSFCERCLETYRDIQFRGAAQIPCPVCQQETVLPEKGIPGLKTNFPLVGMVEDFALQEKVQKAASPGNAELRCEVCKCKEASHRCLDCRQNICCNCRATHLQFSVSSNHTVATFEDIREGKVKAKTLPQENASKCQKHKGEVKRFYCETCHELICRDCTVIDHYKPQHHYIDCEDAATKYKQSISNKISSLKRNIGRLETSLTERAEAKQVFNDNVIKTQKAVQAKATTVIAEVRATEKRLLEEIETYKQDYNNKQDAHEKAVNKMLQRKQHSLETATEVTSTASDSDFLSLFPVINKDLDMLSSQSPLQRERKLWYVRFMENQTVDINLGKLVLEGDTWELCRKLGKQGEFESARGIAAFQPDEIAVAYWVANQIVIYSNQGEIKSCISDVNIAYNIAATPNHWVAANSDIVKVYRKDNTPAFEFRTVPQSDVGKTDVQLVSVAVKQNGNIIVGDTKRKVLTEHNPTDGSLIRTMPVEITPDFLAIMSNGRIAVSSWDQGQVDVVDDNTVTMFTIKPTIQGQQVKHCSGVCCNILGIYIAVSTGLLNSGHIHHYDNSGTFVSCLTQGLYNAKGITFTPDGHQLAVADSHSVKIYRKVCGCHPA